MTTEIGPARAGVDYFLVERADLRDGDTFDGGRYGGQAASFILVDSPPGEGPKLHRHAYTEIFVVLEGQAMYRVGTSSLEVHAGQTVVVPAGVAHAFTAAGPGRLRQVDIHVTDNILTEWLED
jgi:mannose-6-phosphate isomerase-like protein (cupin superfamily)